MLFNGGHKPSDLTTYEKLLSLIESGDFKFSDKVKDIMTDFKSKLEDAKLPLPSGM
jgi:hypothetical protein